MDLSKLLPEHLRFEMAPISLEPTTAETKLRKFQGIAYTGDVINNHYYWGSVIFELQSIQTPAKLPALMNHDRDRIVGFSDSHSITESGFAISGILSSSTPDGIKVSSTSDEGFPWQMSVHIQPSRIEEVLAGVSVEVNGRSLVGPLFIFKDSTIVEVSFTPTGWDSGTTAVAMSKGGDLSNPAGELTMSNPAEKNAEVRVQELEAEVVSLTASLATVNASFAELKASKRKEQITELFSKLGKASATDADFAPYMGMDETAFSMVSTHMLASKPTLPGNLFTHQAESGQDLPDVPMVEAANALIANATARAGK